MTDTNPPAPEEPHKVGYGNPPIETRWEKGQSGNPGGKKKGATNFKTSFLKAAGMKVNATNSRGRTQKMIMLEAFFDAVSYQAASGNHTALEAYIALTDKHVTESPAKAFDYSVRRDAEGVFILHPVVMHKETIEEIKRLEVAVRARADT